MKKFFWVAPARFRPARSIPPAPLSGFNVADNQLQRRAIRSFATPFKVYFVRFLTFKLFHACNCLKIKKLSVNKICSTQQFLTLRKGINISAYLQALQRV